MNSDDDKRLMARIARGDRQAFTALYESTSTPVFHYLQRFLRSREGAEDMLIEVYTQVWQGAGKFRGQSKVRTWIFGIARNLALNELRRTSNRPMDPLPETLADALTELSAKHREIIDLVFFHEMLYSEIATLLDISVNTVKTRIHYAKAALENEILRLEAKKR